MEAMKRTALLALWSLASVAAGAESGSIPPPSLDAPLAKGGTRSVVVAGGCFWGIQAVFQHVRGVQSAVSGYSGGAAWTAHYQMVSLGMSGHAESVQVSYDPSRVSLGQLLRVFFSVAHDPTQKNRQGPDQGTQYRSAIFFSDAEQERIARAYVAQLDQAGVFERKIATEIAPLAAFYVAEAYHQDYATRHPDAPYIRINDAPKVERLRVEFPDLYVSPKK